MISLGDWHGMIGVGQQGSLFETLYDIAEKPSDIRASPLLHNLF
jgi:hypothetical protein